MVGILIEDITESTLLAIAIATLKESPELYDKYLLEVEKRRMRCV